jgi:hypothetical protein
VRNRLVLGVLVILALLSWAALLTFMQRQPPVMVNQLIFVAMFSCGAVCTLTPLSYAINARVAPSLGSGGDMNRALRQGMLFGMVGGVIMALHLIRMLPPERGLVLLAIVALVEALFYIRRR